MANDEFDNAKTDKAMLERYNREQAEKSVGGLLAKAAVAVKEEGAKENPYKDCLTDAICPECRGSGLDAEQTVFECDEFNPEGYWHTEPCAECDGTGLGQGIRNAMEKVWVQEQELRETNKLLGRVTEKVAEWQKWVNDTPSQTDENYAAKADETIGNLVDDMGELLSELAPEGL